VRRSLWDEDEALRPVAHAAVREIGHPDTALAFVPFLGEESISARMRTVEALNEFRDLRAAPYLLAALENNLALQQMYDSQVREATALTTGSVAVPGGGVVTLPRLRRIRYDPLDKESRAKLATERSLLVSALGALVGENHGTDLARWRAGIEKKNLKE
jgi:HEAT repeat protein